MKIITTHSPEETMELAFNLAKHLNAGDFLALTGDLGAGKTVFVKGLAKGLGVKDHLYVNSPSFVLMKEYTGDKKLYHFDVYRLDRDSCIDTLDLDTYFYGDGIVAVEWANKIADILPDEYIEVKIEHAGTNDRKFSFNPVGEKYKEIVNKL